MQFNANRSAFSGPKDYTFAPPAQNPVSSIGINISSQFSLSEYDRIDCPKQFSSDTTLQAFDDIKSVPHSVIAEKLRTVVFGNVHDTFSEELINVLTQQIPLLLKGRKLCLSLKNSSEEFVINAFPTNKD